MPSRPPASAAACLPLLVPAAVALAAAADAAAQSAAPAAADARRALPIVLQARELRGRPDLEAVAEGAVELQRGEVSIAADRLTYEWAEDLAIARGQVRIRRADATYSGPELQLRLQRFEGFFLEPEFVFERLGTHGNAARVDFIDSARSQAVDARYTSCPRDGSGDPDWVLETERVKLDLDANEGVAEGARLRFLGVPILALPTLSFPLTDARKSGWLPPDVNIDNRSGFELAVPYYWNIAPNRDATLTPRVMTRRGVALDTEFRYLEPRHAGQFGVDWLPHDRAAARSRWALQFEHDSALPYALRGRAEGLRVSDDGWWKDFPRSRQHLLPRLLPLQLQLEREFAPAGAALQLYARVLRWQVLQDVAAPIVAPYARSPQLGLRLAGAAGPGLEFALETELNRFVLDEGNDGGRPVGNRWHLLGSVARPWRAPGWWLVPRFVVNAASYRTEAPMADGRLSASRVVPTFAVDAGLEFERRTTGFGRALRQTLEPRLLYVRTPFRDQSTLPNFDAAGKDFNFASVFADNAFSGIDRVADAHQVTAGVTSRLVDEASGGEALRLGVVQRYLLRDQQITPEGVPFTRRFSDLLLLGSTGLVPGWWLDASVQYSPDLQRSVRSVLAARWSPGPFRTLAATYRLARGSSEQLELGWQWPIVRPPAVGAGRCAAAWYGVGRINYSLQDSRITDSIAGFEVDAGCWIGRVVAERRSTGVSDATTRVLLQIEFVGLSRLGANPLQVLKDNIPGYRLLREERGARPEPASP